MKPIANELPAEIAQQLHPDRIKNEQDYWAARDTLLETYRGQWVGFAQGRVIASGRSPVAVLRDAEQSGLHPFLICVGSESHPTRIRRQTFGYDTDYPGEPLPILDVEFCLVSGSRGQLLDRVIPDTGADASVLPWADCQSLNLSVDMGVQGLLSGVAGSATGTLSFLLWARIDNQEYACRMQADFVGSERILGRDVLNQISILFRGPASEVVVNPSSIDD